MRGRDYIMALHCAACLGSSIVAALSAIRAIVGEADVRLRVHKVRAVTEAAGAISTVAPRLVAGRAVPGGSAVLVVRGQVGVEVGSGAELVRAPDCVVETSAIWRGEVLVERLFRGV